MFQSAGKRAKLHFVSYLFRHAPFSILIAGITAIANVSPVIAQVAVRIPDSELQVNTIQNINGQVWLGTADGVYRVDNNTPKRIGDPNWTVNDIENINGQVWLTTDKGAYRVDEDVTVAVDLDSKGFGWQLINKISLLKVWVSPVMPKPCYTRVIKSVGKPDPDSAHCGNDPYDKSFRREFNLIMETDKNEFDKAVKAN